MAPQIPHLTVDEALQAMRGTLLVLQIASEERDIEEVRRGLVHLERIRRALLKRLGQPKPWNRRKSWVNQF
jgi:hypothetical protein